MNLYPAQLRQIADLCEALNAVEKAAVERSPDDVLFLQNGIPVVGCRDTKYGYLSDEVGGSWSFFPNERPHDAPTDS